MEFLFNPSLQIFALFFAGFSLAGVIISLVIFFVEYAFLMSNKFKALYREMREQKKNSQEGKEVIAHILLPDESHAPIENSMTIESEQGEARSENIEEIKSIDDDAIVSDDPNKNEEGIDLETGGHVSTHEPDETDLDQTMKTQDVEESEKTAQEGELSEEELYERIKKPAKTSLQGDIFVSNQPHTTLEISKEEDQIDVPIALDSPSDDLINEVHLHISRGDYTKAHPLIIEGLSFDRHHKVLNIALAEVYESESDYHRAEILYADIIRKHGKDADLLARLALMLSFAGKYQTSYELYQEAYILDNTSDEVISMLLNLAALLGDYRASKEFAEIYLKKYPRHIDTLEVQAKNALELRDGVLFDKTVAILRGLAGFDARTHARVADLMQERSNIGELYYNE